MESTSEHVYKKSKGTLLLLSARHWGFSMDKILRIVSKSSLPYIFLFLRCISIFSSVLFTNFNLPFP